MKNQYVGIKFGKYSGIIFGLGADNATSEDQMRVLLEMFSNFHWNVKVGEDSFDFKDNRKIVVKELKSTFKEIFSKNGWSQDVLLEMTFYAGDKFVKIAPTMKSDLSEIDVEVFMKSISIFTGRW